MEKDDEVIELFRQKSPRTTLLRTSGLSSDNLYEQISIREVVARIKDKSINKSFSSTTKLLENFEPEADHLNKYAIEVPKSGMLYRDEYLPPIYLPIKCNNEYIDTLNNNNNVSNIKTAQPIAAIRNVIYCRDKLEFIRYQEENIGKGLKSHFGLTFESNFECGNLYKAESVIYKGFLFSLIKRVEFKV
jgi:hypothetical protein